MRFTININKHCDCGAIIDKATIQGADMAATSEAVWLMASSEDEKCSRCLTADHPGWSGEVNGDARYQTANQ